MKQSKQSIEKRIFRVNDVDQDPRGYSRSRLFGFLEPICKYCLRTFHSYFSAKPFYCEPELIS